MAYNRCMAQVQKSSSMLDMFYKHEEYILYKALLHSVHTIRYCSSDHYLLLLVS